VYSAALSTPVMSTPTCDTNFHLEPDPERRRAPELLGADFNVFVLRLLGQVKHVRGEESFAVLLEVLFVGLEHTIEPWEELLGGRCAGQLDVLSKKS
jgi:hypothetical protein